MVTITFAQNEIIPAGDGFLPTSGSLALPGGLHDISVHLDAALVPPTDTVSLMLQWSYDGGATWRDECGIAFPGGSYIPFKKTVPTTIRMVNCSIPQSPYPQLARIKTNAPQQETVSASGTIS